MMYAFRNLVVTMPLAATFSLLMAVVFVVGMDHLVTS